MVIQSTSAISNFKGTGEKGRGSEKFKLHPFFAKRSLETAFHSLYNIQQIQMRRPEASKYMGTK